MHTHKVSAAGRRWMFWGMAMGCLSVAGCGTKNRPVEPVLARTSLEAALASWKQGEQPTALAARTPAIIITDFAWRDGWKLADYRLLGDGTSDGFNMHYKVELVLADPRGAPKSEQVTYIVGTSPVITISRNEA